MVRAIDEVSDAEGCDESKTEDGEANEDVFRKRVSNHCAGDFDDAGRRWTSFIFRGMWVILSSWSREHDRRS